MSDDPKLNVIPYSYGEGIAGFLNPKMVCAIEVQEVRAGEYCVVAVFKDESIPIFTPSLDAREMRVRKMKISPDFTYDEAREMAAEFAENCF